MTINQQDIVIPHEHYAYYGTSTHECKRSRADKMEVYLQCCIHLMQSVFVRMLTLFAGGVPDCAAGMNERSSFPHNLQNNDRELLQKC